MSQLDAFQEILNNDNVDVAIPDYGGRQRYDKVDKKALSNKLKTENKLVEIQNILQESSFEERLKWIENKKIEGDTLYNKKQFSEALQIYLESLMGVQDKSKLDQQQIEQMNCLQLKILCNMSVTAFENKNFEQSLRFLDQAKKIQQNSRVYYLISLNEQKQEKFEQSLENQKKSLEKAYQEQKDQNTIEKFKKRIKILEYQVQQVQSQEKSYYRNIFKKEIYQDKKCIEQAKPQKINIGCWQRVKNFIKQLINGKIMLKLIKNSFCKIKGTTIFAIRKNGQTVIMGDGQVSQGSILVKNNAQKIKELKPGVFCGFAGSLADCITLMEQLEIYLEKYPKHQLLKPCIELAKKWRTESSYKRLEASIIVLDKKEIIEIDGCGNVMTHDQFRGIGSGSFFAECAAEALYDLENFTAEMIANKSMLIASKKCIYTNNNFVTKIINDIDEQIIKQKI